MRFLVEDIAEPSDHDLARAAAAFLSGPTPEALVDEAGRILARNEADRNEFGDEFGDAPAIAARFADQAEARRALRAALDGDGFAHFADMAPGRTRRQVVYRRVRDPQSGAPAVLCAFPDKAEDDARARAALAHDMRSPLNAIQGFAEYMQLSGDNLGVAERAAYLDDIRTACAAMLTLVETMVEEAVAATAPARVDLAAMVGELARLHDPAARRAGGRIAVTAEPGAAVVAEPIALRRALDNLIDNAVRHGGGVVDIRAGEAEIVVSDQGPGAGAARLNGAARADASGRPGGLGLSNARMLAEEIGGRLVIETAEGRGFTARLTLPRDQAGDAGVERAAQTQGGGPREA